MIASDRREVIESSYLEHIIIAVNAGDRGAPFRDFLDNWYAFRTGTGHLTKGGRPVWFNNPCAHKHQDALSNMQFISQGARAVLANARGDKGAYLHLRTKRDPSIRLMVDHAVPLRVIVDQLFDERMGNVIERTSKGILQHLCRFYRLGVITAKEDDRLNKAGLKAKMPAMWDGENVFARYQFVDIT